MFHFSFLSNFSPRKGPIKVSFLLQLGYSCVHDNAVIHSQGDNQVNNECCRKQPSLVGDLRRHTHKLPTAHCDRMVFMWP